MKISGISEHSINKIFFDLNLNAIQKISYLHEIRSTPAFDIDNRYIIKFDVWDQGVIKFNRYKLACDYLYSTNVPVPQVIHIDSSKSLVPYAYFIITKLPGMALVNKTIDDNYKKNTIEIGKILAHIHQYKLHKFGDLAGDPSEHTDSWVMFIEKLFLNAYNNITSENIIASKLIKILEKIFLAHRNLLEDVHSPVLVHGDFDPSNVLISKSQVSGIIDFDQALAGDSEFDFANLQDYQHFTKHLLAGYQTISKLSDHFEKKVKFYELLVLMRLVLVAKQFWLKRDFLNMQKKLVAKINSW